MVPCRYARALDDLFTYQMGDGPAGVPRLFIARSWLPTDGPPGSAPVAWLMNAINRAEAVECSEIVRNILLGMAEDQADTTISQTEAEAILVQMRRRVTLLGYEDSHAILDNLGIPLNFVEYAHKCIERIDVIPFTLETGFGHDIVTNYSRWIPLGE